MKLQPDRIDAPSITAYGEGWVAVSGQRITHSVVLASTGEQFDWQCARFEALTPDHFAQLLALPIEMVIFGRLAPFMQRRIGVETMNTLAACRTYNILAGEGRKVALAVVLEASEPAQP